MRALLLLLAATTTAFAGELTVNEQDQQNLQAVCDIAARSMELNREGRANIAAYCVAWEKRVQDAKPKTAEAPKQETKEPSK